ncbi:MAG: Divergent polysaccharide deacetylase [Deltaproteobacteria bacterium ADurb.Bin510]|nr:MAG: Divergent polysaccharide deacetylase [Deltaproteobacteria bacterium ADurb.Bin510]
MTVEPAPGGPCTVAIIVDDIGVNMAAVKRLAAIDAELTFSVMPQLPGSRPAAHYLSARGREVMLHQPMESLGGNQLGPGAIVDSMQPAEARAILKENLDSLPMVKGLNNHEGSRVTQNRVLMEAVLGELKNRGLFFVDSLTTSKSVGREVARENGVPVAVRQVFLDNEQNPAYIKGQLARLEKVARKNGGAIAICHPHNATVSTLESELPAMQRRGVRIVPVSSFVRG